MVLGVGYEHQGCYVARSLEIVGERWTLLILRDCCYGVRRFNDFLAHLDISRAVLADRLETLVRAGVLERRPVGRCIDYELTSAGIQLWPIVHELHRWGEEHLDASHPARIFTHAGCGTELGAGARCPSCELLPPLSEVLVRPGQGPNRRARDDRIAVALRQPHRMLSPFL